MSNNFCKDFKSFVKTTQFLELPSQELAKILSNNSIAMKETEIFQSVCRWAEHQCFKLNVPNNPENVREVLGKCLIEIRFPLMSLMEFSKIVCPTKILTKEETSCIFEYLSMDDCDRCGYEVSRLGFKVHKRHSKKRVPMDLPVCKVFIIEDYVVENEPSLKEDDFASVFFYVDERIEVVGVGIPCLQKNTGYEVLVEPRMEVYGQWASCGKIQKEIGVDMEGIIYLNFEQSIICDASDFSATPYNFCIRYGYKIPGWQSPSSTGFEIEQEMKQEGATYISKTESGVTFNFRFKSKAKVEIIFRKLEC